MRASFLSLLPTLFTGCESDRSRQASNPDPKEHQPDTGVADSGIADSGRSAIEEDAGARFDAAMNETPDTGHSSEIVDSGALEGDADAGEEANCISQEEIWRWEEFEYYPQGAPGRTCFDIPRELASQGPLVFCPTIYRSISVCGRNLEGMLTLMGTTLREPNGERKTIFADPPPDENAPMVFGALFFFENAHVTVQNIAFHYGSDAISHQGGGSLTVDGVETSNTTIYYQSLSMEDEDDIWRNGKITDPNPDRSVTVRNSNLGSIKDERDLALAFENVRGDVTLTNNILDGGAYAVRVHGTTMVVNDNEIQGDLTLEGNDCNVEVRDNRILPRLGAGIFVRGLGPLFGSVRDNVIDATRSDSRIPAGIVVRDVVQQPGRPLSVEWNRITIPNGQAITVEDSAGVTVVENSLVKIPVEGRVTPWTGVHVKKSDRNRIEPEDIVITNNVMSYDPSPRRIRYEEEGAEPYEIEFQDRAIQLEGSFSEEALFYSDNLCFDATAEGEAGVECRVVEE